MLKLNVWFSKMHKFHYKLFEDAAVVLQGPQLAWFIHYEDGGDKN